MADLLALETERTVLQRLLAATEDAIERSTKRQRREDDRGFKPWTRPMGMYFNFQGAKLKELQAEQPLATLPQLMKQVAKCWGKMDRLERAPWAKAAEEERITYERDLAAYNDV